MTENATLANIADDIQNGSNRTRISVGELIKSIKGRGFSALILLPALLTFLPTGAIPGMPAICALLIIGFAGQRLFGLKQVYLPRKLMKLTVSRQRLDAILQKAKPALHATDRLISRRLEFVCNPLAERVVAGLAILLALTFFPLGIIPFAVLLPSAAILLMSLGLLARDGVVLLLGIALIGGVFFLLPGIGPT